jgi:hypothetical protein
VIDLHKNKKVVYDLLNKANIPSKLIDEKFQDFAVYFYSNYKYDGVYAVTTYIHLLFRNWLALCAIKYKTKDKVPEQLSISYDERKEDWLDWVQRNMEDFKPTTQSEVSIYCQEVFNMLQPLTQEYVLEKAGKHRLTKDEDSIIKRVSREEGISRQGVELRIKKDLNKVLKNL